MKKIFLAVGAFLAFTAAASAQVEKSDSQQEDVQDKIQQEPPRETERRVERSAEINAKTDVNAKNTKNVRAADEKLKKEKEKSTGKESKNPAETNQVVAPVQPEPPKQRN